MSVFEHFSVFFSIILGLGVVHLLGGISLILDTRIKTRVYWVHLVWTVNLLLMTTLVWVGNYALADVDNFSTWHVLNMVVYSMMIYLMCGLLYPVRGAEVTDFKEHFESNRTRLYIVGIFVVLTDAVDGLMEQKALGSELNPFQYGTLSVYLLLFLLGLKIKTAWFHGLVAVVFLLGLLGFLKSLVDFGLMNA